MSSWQFASWGSWKDSRFEAVWYFNGWFMEANHSLSWVVGLDGKVVLKALKLLKVSPERTPAQFGPSKSFKRKSEIYIQLAIIALG